jgi:glucosylceramidase
MPTPTPHPTARAWVTSPIHAVSPIQVFTTEAPPNVQVHEHRERQVLFGVGGSLTQASAAALATVSPDRRAEVLTALFGPGGAAYSLARTHVASCDFSTSTYTYSPAPRQFSIDVDRQNGHLALIRDALAVPGASFRLIASPWTAPPWMKDNGLFFERAARRGGSLLAAHYEDYAHYIAQYLEAYAAEGVPVWAVTPVNEPHGNHGTWESTEMTPEEQRAFVPVLGRVLRERGLHAKVLIYDQNRKSVVNYATTVLSDPDAAASAFGTAVHWYDSSFRVYQDELERLHAAFPDHPILHTEGCIDSVYRRDADRGPDAPTPWWRDDGWFWRKEAMDWGWDWEANPEVDHPPYVPAFRYARDLVGGLAHRLAGWVDWNIVLDRRGGPNHVGNFCLAPILVDGETDSVYYTPLYHILRQVSRDTRPGAVVLETEGTLPTGVWLTALRDPSGACVVHVFNETDFDWECRIRLCNQTFAVRSHPASLLTLRIE